MYQLNIKLNADLSPNIKNYYKNYAANYKGDSGIDLITPNDITIYQNGLETINFGISCNMINLKENKQVSYFLFPRSSISSTGLYLANATGIIDSGYRGKIMAKIRYIPIFINSSIFNKFYLWIMDFFYSNKTFIKKETRLFQICAPNLDSIQLNIVDELDDTERGDKGFGSTGVWF